MIIGIDASRANTDERTGTEWYAYHVIEQLKALVPETDEVRIYTREPLLPDMAALPKNWTSVVLSWPPAYMWTQFRLSVEMIVRKPDVLYVPAHTIPLVHPKNTVTVIHDVGFLHEQELYNTTVQRSSRSFITQCISIFVRLCTLGRYRATENDYHRFSLHRALAGASDIITISDFSKQEIIAYAPQVAKKLHRIYNGLRPLRTQSNTPQNTATVLEKFGLQKGTFFVTVGRIEEKKNSPMLVDAFAEMVEQGYAGSLVYIGKPGYGYESVQQKIQQHHLEKRVLCTGYLDDSETFALLQSASAFVFPTRYEGFGMPVLEAMQMNVPVICSDIPVLREVAGTAALFVEPRSKSAWATECMRLTQDPALAETLVQRGQKQLQLFSWKSTAIHTWEILNNYRTS